MANCSASFFIVFWRSREQERNRSDPLSHCLVVTCPVLPLSPSTLITLHKRIRECLTPPIDLLFTCFFVLAAVLFRFHSPKKELSKGLFASRRIEKVPPYVPSLPSSHACPITLSHRCTQPFKKVVEKTLEFCRLISPFKRRFALSLLSRSCVVYVFAMSIPFVFTP